MGSTSRTALAAMFLALAATPAIAADACGDLVEKIAAAAKAEIANRTEDSASFRVSDDFTLTLACGGKSPSSLGAQFRGRELPEGFFAGFGESGHAVTGVEPAVLADAARRASKEASSGRHGLVPAGRVVVTCAVRRPAEAAPITLCAAIDKGDRR